MNHPSSPVAFSLAVTLSLAALSGITPLAAFPMPNTAAPPAGGTVFSFGRNFHGRTGLGTNVGRTLVATPIDTTHLGGRSIKQVAAGDRHSLLLADGGTVFSFGINDYGRTGLSTALGTTTVATPIDTSNLGGRSIKQVAAGGNHSLLLAEDGTVFSFGRHFEGQAGRSTDVGIASIATPIDTTNLGGRVIKQVAAGEFYSLLLGDDGTVFSFGVNFQTGLGTDVGITRVATPIDTTNLGGRSIKQVAAGYGHSLLLADDGTVFSFGSNGEGRTGLGRDARVTTIATPIDTTNLGGRSIKQIAAGRHSLLLAEDGTIFSFGSNLDGRTGLGTDVGNTIVATPIDATNLGGRSIKQIAAGDAHSLLLTEDGAVFSFGRHFEGQAGLGTNVGITTIATPIVTTNLAGLRVIDISAGSFHSLLVAVPEPGSLALFLFSTALLWPRRR